jgi:hypothetical protein
MMVTMDKLTENRETIGSAHGEPPREDSPRTDEPDAAYRAAVRRYACLSGRRR